MVDMYGIPPDVIEFQRVENERAAKAVVGKRLKPHATAGIAAEARACLTRPSRQLPAIFAPSCAPVRPVDPWSAGAGAARP